MRAGEYRMMRSERFCVIADRIFVGFERESFAKFASLTADPGMYNKTGFFKRDAVIIGRTILSPPVKKIHFSASFECLKI